MTDKDKDHGTGRTMAMVKELVDGATVVVHTGALRLYVHKMICEHRPDLSRWRVVAIYNVSDCDRLRGLGGPIVVDHAFWGLQFPALTDRVRALMTDINSRRAA